MSLRALARFCYRRRRLVVGCWLAALVGVNVLAAVAGTNFTTNFSAPNTESTRATNLLQANFKAQSGDAVQVVLQGTPSMADPAVKEQVHAFSTALAKVPHVLAVTDPYATPGSISRSGTIALANAQLDSKSQDISNSVGSQMIKLADAHTTPHLKVRLGGQLIQQSERPSLSGEGIGILAAIVILLIAFGSVLAMVLPIVVALSGIAVGLPIIGLLTHVYPLQSFATTLATMIGIGVGIDYALFVVTRYRQGLHAGLDPEEAVITAIDTSGRAVLFAGLTVIIALLGMLAIGLSFISGLGIGAAAVVALTVAAAVTLLPAALGFVGSNVDKWRLPWVHNDGDGTRQTMWHRWSRFVQHHAAAVTIAGLAVVLALALPVLSLRLGFADAGNDPAGTQTREAYDLLSRGFGPGFNGPFLLAVDLPPGGDATDLNRLEAAVKATPGVASTTPAIVSPSGTTAVMRVYPTTAPQDEETSRLLHHLRREVIPNAVAGTGATVYVGGFTALTDDFADLLGQRLPLFIGIVILLSFLLLMAVFRSILVPLKAAVMNLLSVGAAYGVIVMIFQWGWGKGLVGIDKAGPIQAFLPIMMFAILFGLSMDYEVFLLSRIREEYLRTGNNAQAVADGLSATARVITAAAAIMCTFFLSFVLGDNIVIKLFGIGFASAIFIDATLIRLVIVPSTMELLGDANWWLPDWLDRIIPHLDVEGPHAEVADDAASGPSDEPESVPVGAPMTDPPPTDPPMTDATVVVVGGGYGGVNAAKALDEHCAVVLIEPKDAFVHNVATLRALVEPEFAPRIFLPYDQLLTRGRVVRDRAVHVSSRRVVVASGAEFPADFVVLASGSSYPFPAKTDRDDTHAALDQYAAAHDRLEHAERVLLIGAGAVGIELAGEIKATWPRKHVTLLDAADDVLGDTYRADLRTELRAQLAEIGVEVVLGAPLRALPSVPETELGPFTVETEAGDTISADLWFRCFGVTPVSDYLAGDDLAGARRPDGFVRVRPTLQVEGHDRVFAIGDVADADAKMAGRAGRQAHLVAENIRKLIDGSTDLSPYEPLPPAIIVPIGPKLGSGQLPNQEGLATRELVSAAKGQDLMVDRYAEILGVTVKPRE